MFHETKSGEIVTVHVDSQQLNAAIAPQFKEVVAGIAKRGDRNIIVDLKNIEFIDSTALGALVSGLKSVAPDGHFTLCGANATVEAMLQITRMERILRTYPDEASAREALQGVAG